MAIDQVLALLALSMYAVSAIALAGYFFSREIWLRHFGIPLALSGCFAQFAQLVARYELTGVWPLLNLYGSLSLFCALSVAIFAVFAFKYDLWFAGGFVTGLAALFFAYAQTWNEGTLPPVPSLQSYWIKIHIPLVISAYAAFLVAFVLAVIYLVKYYGESALQARVAAPVAADAGGAAAASPLQFRTAPQRPLVMRSESPALDAAAARGDRFALWLATLPSLGTLDVLIYRVIGVGLPLLTVGIITGAWWAKEAWGAYWQWDPKETAALFCWIVYASYMHLHTRNSWRGVRSAWLATLGFIAILFCYFGVNIWISGLHSYKL